MYSTTTTTTVTNKPFFFFFLFSLLCRSSLPSKIKAMKMGQFMQEYDCSLLQLLLSGNDSTMLPEGAVHQDAPMGRYGTIKTPARKKTNIENPETPMDQGTGDSAMQLGTFSVIRGAGGVVQVQLPDGRQVNPSDATDSEKEAAMKTLQDAQAELNKMMNALK
tara:strand:+ start:432 stop:920 length:489 start_codon:yes stop_codon:yes gene_type:complete